MILSISPSENSIVEALTQPPQDCWRADIRLSIHWLYFRRLAYFELRVAQKILAPRTAEYSCRKTIFPGHDGYIMSLFIVVQDWLEISTRTSIDDGRAEMTRHLHNTFFFVISCFLRVRHIYHYPTVVKFAGTVEVLLNAQGKAKRWITILTIVSPLLPWRGGCRGLYSA